MAFTSLNCMCLFKRGHRSKPSWGTRLLSNTEAKKRPDWNRFHIFIHGCPKCALHAPEKKSFQTNATVVWKLQLSGAAGENKKKKKIVSLLKYWHCISYYNFSFPRKGEEDGWQLGCCISFYAAFKLNRVSRRERKKGRFDWHLQSF